MAAWRPFVLVLLPFAAGYYLSYVFRTINALIAGPLTSELGLDPADLGLLTSLYFLAMATVQMPLGTLLDRFGPRRVQSACLVFAALGAGVFACATSLPELMLGRALIGLGFAAALMASLKAIVLWFPKDRIAFANGWVVMLGALGAVTATLPAESLVALLGWRELFLLLAIAIAACALTVYLIVPEPLGRAPLPGSPRIQLRRIYQDPRFLRLAPLSTLCIGSSWSLQGLWVAPWLQHVEKIDRPGVVQHLLVMGVALSVGALLLGWGADRLRRLGVPRETFLAIVAILFIAAQLALIMRVPIPTYVPWAIVAAVGAATVISFAILTEYFPKEMSARANAALNILHLTGAFLLQYLTGIIVSLWPLEAGLPPAAAYQTAVGLCVVLQCGTMLWFLVMARAGQIPVFSAVPSTTQGMTATQQHAVDYRNAQLAIVRHVARARTQLAHWRRIAIASATVCVCLGVLFGNTIQSRVLAYVVEVPSASATLRSEYSARPRGSSVADLRNDCAMPRVISLRHPHWPQVGGEGPCTAPFQRMAQQCGAFQDMHHTRRECEQCM